MAFILLLLIGVLFLYVAFKNITSTGELKAYLYLHHPESWESTGGSMRNSFALLNYVKSAQDDDDENVLKLKKKVIQAVKLMGLFWALAILLFVAAVLYVVLFAGHSPS